MPYDPNLADRIRALLEGAPGLVERKMFGGVGFMIQGNMAAGASSQGGLIVRTSKEESVALVQAEPGAALMEQRGRPMRGWVLVEADQVADDEALARWVRRGRAHACSLPPK